jgi:type IX secretion system PorP/SprF family membrane protein
MRTFILICCTTAFSVISTSAQIDPLYAQYLNNPLLINPAYSGHNNNLNAVASFRKQWAGFDGSPLTLTASGHMSLLDNKMGAGLIVMKDQAGASRNTEVHATYAYKLEFKKMVLSFGLQTGFISFKNDYSDLEISEGDDPVFGNGQNYTKPSFGAGAILSSERFFVGLSVPRMLKAPVSINNIDTDLYQQHFYLTGAYVIFLNEHIRMKPSILLRGVKGAPLSADLNYSFNIDEKYTAGAFVRNFKTYGLMGQLKIKENLRFGYAFELPSNRSVGTNYTTHEFMVGINMSVFSFHSTSITNF